MSAAMKSMNLEKISGLMDQFEKEFEDLDVQTSVMEGAMSQSTATNIPQDSVENLMRQAADEAGLELNMDLPGPAQQTVDVELPGAVPAVPASHDLRSRWTPLWVGEWQPPEEHINF